MCKTHHLHASIPGPCFRSLQLYSSTAARCCGAAWQPGANMKRSAPARQQQGSVRSSTGLAGWLLLFWQALLQLWRLAV